MLSPPIVSASAHPPQPLAAAPTPLEHALARHDADALERLLRGSRISADALRALLDQACRQPGCPLRIKLALLAHGAVAPAQALDLAVRHDDLELAHELLTQGAAPERHHLRHGNADMRALLTYARRRARLYPPGADLSRYTDLDDALRAGDLDEARNILARETGGAGVRAGWRDAVRNGRADILRALLLLGMADADPGFRLLEDPDAVIEDAAVRETMKEIPYHSPKRGLPRNLNHAVRGICENIVHYRHGVAAADPALKAGEHAGSEDGIRGLALPSHQEIQRTRNLASEVHLVKNSMVGAFIADRFEAMASTGEKGMLIEVNSTWHSLSLELRIKPDADGRTVHVARLLDPNRTNTPARSASDELAAFEAFDIGAFVHPGLLESYFADTDVSRMTVRPPEDVLASSAAQVPVAAGRTLTSTIGDAEVDPAIMWHLLDGGFAGDLRRLKDEIARRPPAERAALLAARRINGTPGLFMALQHGHADAVRAYGELLSLVPEEERAGLLAARRADGCPGLYMALQYGHADAVRAFGELLDLVPDAQRADLLAVSSPAGDAGSAVALEQGHAGAMQALGDLLPRMPAAGRAEFLARAAKALPEAMKRGRTAAVDVYAALCTALAPELDVKQRQALRKAIKRSQGIYRFGLSHNYRFYEVWKVKNPDAYLRFKAMKTALRD